MTRAGELGRTAAERVPGSLAPDEAAALAELASGRLCLELGSSFGRSAAALAATAALVVCIDRFRLDIIARDAPLGFYATDIFRHNLREYANVVTIAADFESAAPVIQDGRFDLVFIDGGHRLEEVAADIRRWSPKVKSGGTIAFHDYGNPDFPGVKTAVDNFGRIERLVGLLAWLTLSPRSRGTVR